jgi:uncharacterized protein YdeI (YjbR/CyaY-like superfamily)
MPKAPARGTRLKRPSQPMPAFVKAALAKSRLMARYRERPPYQRNDYLMWINQAKLDATRQKRLRQMLAELRSGDAYMGMAWRLREKP